MRKLKIIPVLLASLLFINCSDDDDSTPRMLNSADFTVTIENVATGYSFVDSGVFNTPVGESDPGPATPGKTYEFSINAGKNHKVSFVTMLAATNDLFFAPKGEGIALYDENGDPVNGDVTDQVYLWDAGTEVNEEPGVGPNTVGNQSGPDTGVEENGNVLLIEDVTSGFDFDYPAVNQLINVSITHNSGTEFTVSLEDLSGAMLQTSEGTKPAPISPGVYVVHRGMNPLFTEGMPDPGQGVEEIAEDGNPSALADFTSAATGITYPASPGVWIVHEQASMPLFTEGAEDYGDGVEAIAEDGNAAPLASALTSLDGYISGELMNTPQGNNGPGPILPGSSYQFSFTAEEGDYLSFVSMLAATNDVFFAPADEGIPLFNTNGEPATGNVTSMIFLWDAGTEVNEMPAFGPNTVTHQAAANTGIDENQPVQLLSAVNDGFNYPTVNSVIMVTISAN